MKSSYRDKTYGKARGGKTTTKEKHRLVLHLQSWKEIREVYLCQNSLRQNISTEMCKRRAHIFKECYGNKY